MALLTIQRSPNILEDRLLSELETFTDSGTGTSTEDEETSKTSSRRLSECYFAGKGAAVALPSHPHPRVSSPSSDIQRHLQSMFYLLRPQETLKMAVKLESVHLTRTRYLVVVSCDEGDESCLLGIDCNERTTVGLVLRVLADTSITLDGDGGFSVCVCGRQHIFKPVSVQAMWSALQTLHKVSSKAREKNYFQNGGTHEWVIHYEDKIESDRSCLNEWHAMDSIESRRPPSPDSLRHKPSQRAETEKIIRSTLKEIMMSVDLDDVTSKYIRTRLEEQLDMDLGEYKPFIDQEMLVVLAQMDAATQIFPHVYLGSEWNASNLEELTKHGVCHILNVTREIDNFFPGIFNYLNIRVYDDDNTDLLKHWDNTYKYITNAKNEGSKVLVHCKMGISRSASVVIAYAMKAYNWDLNKALNHVRDKRNCIKPNANFITQLETYQGILDAMKNREKLQRSKSETNLKCNSSNSSTKSNKLSRSHGETRSSSETKEETPSMTQSHTESPCSHSNFNLLQMPSGVDLSHNGSRPKSWSPDALEVTNLFDSNSTAPISQSLERLNSTEDVPCIPPAPPLPPAPKCYNMNVRMPCGNGLAYSVSQNKVLHLPCTQSPRTCEGGVKGRVSALEANSQYHFNKDSNNENKTFAQLIGSASQLQNDKKSRLVLNLTSQFEPLNNSENLVNKSNQQQPKEKGIKKYFKFINRTHSGTSDKHNTTRHDTDKERKRTNDNEKERNIHKQKELSRQNSWSSHDSAVVLDSVSRQNSWGSYDTTSNTSGKISTFSLSSSSGYDKIEPSVTNTLSSSSGDLLNNFDRSSNSNNEACLSCCKNFVKLEENIKPNVIKSMEQEDNSMNSYGNCCFRRNKNNNYQEKYKDDGDLIADQYTLAENSHQQHCKHQYDESSSQNSHTFSSHNEKNLVDNKKYLPTNFQKKTNESEQENICQNCYHKQHDSVKLNQEQNNHISNNNESIRNYDKRKILKATNCINSVILRKQFYTSSINKDIDDDLSNENISEHKEMSVIKGENVEERISYEGNSTFYVDKNEDFDESGRKVDDQLENMNDSRYDSEQLGINERINNSSSDLISTKNKGVSSKLTNKQTHSNETTPKMNVQEGVETIESSNELMKGDIETNNDNELIDQMNLKSNNISVPLKKRHHRPLSQSCLLNYSNSYPQQQQQSFINKNKFKNHPLSKSSPNFRSNQIIMNSCTQIPTCTIDSNNQRVNRISEATQRSDKNQMDTVQGISKEFNQCPLQRVSSEKLFTNRSNLSIIDNMKRNSDPLGGAANSIVGGVSTYIGGTNSNTEGGASVTSSYGIVKNLKNEFEAKSSLKHQRNSSCSSNGSAHNETSQDKGGGDIGQITGGEECLGFGAANQGKQQNSFESNLENHFDQNNEVNSMSGGDNLDTRINPVQRIATTDDNQIDNVFDENVNKEENEINDESHSIDGTNDPICDNNSKTLVSSANKQNNSITIQPVSSHTSTHNMGNNSPSPSNLSNHPHHNLMSSHSITDIPSSFSSVQPASFLPPSPCRPISYPSNNQLPPIGSSITNTVISSKQFPIYKKSIPQSKPNKSSSSSSSSASSSTTAKNNLIKNNEKKSVRKIVVKFENNSKRASSTTVNTHQQSNVILPQLIVVENQKSTSDSTNRIEKCTGVVYNTM